MASDREDDDLDNLRKAALATLKPKVQPISSISSISRTHPQPNSSWLEFPMNDGIVPEYQFQPEPLPEPNLLQPRQNVRLPIHIMRPQLPQSGPIGSSVGFNYTPQYQFQPKLLPEPNLLQPRQNVRLPVHIMRPQQFPQPGPIGSPVGFNYTMQGQKNFQPRGFFGDRCPFNMRGHQRSFGGSSRPTRDRGRYPRRGYIPDQGRGFFSRGRGRSTPQRTHQFPPPLETESAGGNLIVVINPQLEDAEEKKDNITVTVKNNGITFNTNRQAPPIRSKLVLPQDKYHTATSSAGSEKTSSEPISSKPRDKFSRYDDSDSEEEDDWIDNLISDDKTKIDKFLEDEEEADTRVVEQEEDSEKDSEDTTEGTYEVEIRKLELSDNEDEEIKPKRKGLLEEGCSPITSDNESVDLDVLAGEDVVLTNNIDNKNSSVEENEHSPIAIVHNQVSSFDLDGTQDLSELALTKLDDMTDANETASNLLSSSSSTSSSSSSSSSSGESSSEGEDDEKVEEVELNESGNESLKKSPPSSVPSGEIISNALSSMENASPKAQEHLSSTSQQKHTTSSYENTASSKRLSPVTKSNSPSGLATHNKSFSPRARRSISPQRAMSPPHRTSWSPRKSRSKSPIDSSSLHRRSNSPHRSVKLNRSPQPLSYNKRSVSPRRSLSPRRISPRHGLSPKRFSPLPYSLGRRSPSPRRSLSPRQRSPSPRRSLSPRRRSPLPLRSLSPRRRSPLPPRPLSPRRRSPLPLRSLSPRRRSPLPLRSLSPRRRSPLPLRSLSPRRRSPLPHRSLSPRRRSPLPPRPLSPRRRSASSRRSLSPGQRTASLQRPSSPKQRSLSPRRRFSPKRSLSPTRSPFSSRKRSRSPLKQPVSPRHMSPHFKKTGYSHNRDVSRNRQELWNRDYRTSWHQDGKRYDRGRNSSAPYSTSSHSIDRERGGRIDSNSKYQSRLGERQGRKYTEPSSVLKDSREKHGESPQQKDKRPIVKDVKVEEPPMPQIDLDKLTPEERAKIEARRKKFCSSEVKIDPAKTVSLKSIKERTKKRKKSQQEVPESVPEKRSKGNHKSGNKKGKRNHTSGQGGGNSSSGEDDQKKTAALDDDSEDSDSGRLWKLEGNKTGKQTHRLNIPGKSNHFLASEDNLPVRSAKFSRQGRNDGSHSNRHHRDRRLPDRFRERLPPARPRIKRREDFLSEDDNSDEAVGSSRLTSSIVSSKTFEPDIPPEKLRVKIRVASKDKKSKKSKAKPDFSQAYSVPAKRNLQADAQTKATEVEPVVLTKKTKKKKKDKKKIKYEKELAELEDEPSPEAAGSDEESEAAVELPAPRLSVLERLGKKVPFKPHKEKKKKKKKKSHTDDEEPSELDVKIQKIKEKNAAIARRQQEIELDKKKYG